MLTVTKPAPDRLDVVLEGTLDADKMRQALDDIVRLSADINEGRMLYTIRGFAMPTLGAIGVEFGYLPKLFSLITRFDRCAVCSDTAWVRTAAEVEGAIVPGLDIKSFELDEVDQAESWLAA